MVVFANPGDFSINSETGMGDEHTLRITFADLIDGVTTYVTGGSATHAHEVHFTEEQIRNLQLNSLPTPSPVETDGPVGRPLEHRHTVVLNRCLIPGD